MLIFFRLINISRHKKGHKKTGITVSGIQSKSLVLLTIIVFTEAEKLL